MTLETLRKVHSARPFQPFTLHIADGRRLFVPHPEFLWIPGNVGRTIFVTAEPDAPEFVDLLLITSIQMGARSSNGRRVKKG